MEILQLTIQFLVIHHEPIHRNIMIGELSLPLVNYEFVDEELTLCQNLSEHKPKPVSIILRNLRKVHSLKTDSNFVQYFRFLESCLSLCVINPWPVNCL